MDHTAQIQRIIRKLAEARKVDWRLNVFGASSHGYHLHSPLSERKVCAFEERYSLQLPACFRAFVTGVGNGGKISSNPGAGPYYGIYPLGKNVDELVWESETHLSRPALLRPAMTDEEWEDETKCLNQDGISDHEQEEELGRIYSGILPLGSQGCSYLHALVLNGPYAGRVLNLSTDGDKPKFAFEKNFLDWYERWLDEVISGYLSNGNASWFGYTLGGDDRQLMHLYAEAEDRQTKLHALDGLSKLNVASEGTCKKLVELSGDDDAGIRHQALLMLAKFAYPMARNPLRLHIMSDDDDCLVACQAIHWYGGFQGMEWIGVLRSRLPSVNSRETFTFLSYLLVKSGVDFGEDFRPFCTHPDEKIRSHVFYSLGQLASKHYRRDLFLMGLEDDSPKVVHATLQALAGVRDKELLSAYERVQERFKTDEHYVLTNLALRLKEMRGGSPKKVLWQWLRINALFLLRKRR